MDFNIMATVNNTETDISESNHTSHLAASFSPLDYGKGFTYFLICYLIFVIIGAIIGNLTIITAFTLYKKLRQKINYFIMSLSVSYLIQSIVVVPLDVDILLHEETWRFDVTTCEFNATMFFFSLSASNYSLLGATSYRCLTVVYPYFASKLKRRSILLTIGGIVVYTLVSSSMPILGWNQKPFTVSHGQCLFMFTREWFFSFYTVNFLLPSFLMLLMYLLIYFIARRHAKDIRRTARRFSNQEKMKGSIKLFKCSKTTFKVSIVYIICWFPYVFLLFTYVLCSTCARTIPRCIHALFALMAYSSAVLDPVLFAAWSSNYRSVLRRHVKRAATGLGLTSKAGRPS